MEIQTHNVAHLGHEVRIGAELEMFDAMRLQVIRLPDPLNAGWTDTLLAGHGSHRPMRGIFGFGGASRLDNGGFFFGADAAGSSRSRFIFENAEQAFLLKAPAPEQHRRRTGGKISGQTVIDND